MLFRARTAQILLRSVLLVTTVTATSVAIAVPLAWLTVRTDLPFRRLWGVLTALPLVIPSYVGAFVVVSALGPKGMLQQLLSGILGVDRLPDIYGLSGATITLALLSYPYVLITGRGVIGGLDPSLEESARGLGAGAWSTMARVTLPQLRPAVVSGALLVALYTLADFGAVSLLRYETFTWAIYQQYQSSFDRSTAGVLSLLLLALATLILLMEARSRGRMRYHRTGVGVSRQPVVVELGRWRWPARGILRGSRIPGVGRACRCADVLACPGTRRRGAGAPTVDRGTEHAPSFESGGRHGGRLLLTCSRNRSSVSRRAEPGDRKDQLHRVRPPGHRRALSLVFVGTNLARPVYQTIWLLLLAYLVLHFPAALAATRTSMLQVRPSRPKSLK